MDNSSMIINSNKNESSSQVMIRSEKIKNKVLSFNEPIENKSEKDIRDEQNDFLKNVFRQFKNEKSKYKDKRGKSSLNSIKRNIIINQYNDSTIINQSKMSIKKNSSLADEGNINISRNKNKRFKCFKYISKFFRLKRQSRNLSFREEFPIRSLENYPKEDVTTRILMLLLTISMTFFSIGLKSALTDNFNFATYCDLKKNWEEFDNLVFNKSLIMIKPQKCHDYCNFNGYLISKLFHLDFYIFTVLNFFLFFKSYQLTNRIIVRIYLFLFPFLTNIILDVIFFKDKIIVYIIFSFVALIGIIFLIIDSKNLFLIALTITCPLTYFAFLKFFFESLFVHIFNLNPDVIRVILPFLISIFKYIYFNLLLRIKILSSLHPIYKWICCVLTSLFDLVFLGNLHLLVVDGFKNYKFWINLLLNLSIDINNTFQILPRFLHKLKFYLKNKKIREERREHRLREQQINEELSINDFDCIYMTWSIESEMYVWSIYLFFIIFKYFNMTQSNIVDCFGRPLDNKIAINTNHYFLFCILIVFWALKLLIKFILQKYWFHKEKDYGHFPKLETKLHAIIYVGALIGITMNFGYSGLYTMLSIK